MKELEKELTAVRMRRFISDNESLSKSFEKLGKTNFLTHEYGESLSGEDLRTLALDLRNRMKDCVVVLVSKSDGKVNLVVTVDDLAQKNGYSANVLAKSASSILGGGGGGKNDFAQGGGIHEGKISEALEAIRGIVRG